MLSLPICIATYNIRYDCIPDSITVQQSLVNLSDDPLRQPDYFHIKGEQPWSTRRIRLAQQILTENPIVIGFQEALIRQVKDLAELLGPDWSWIGIGRDDGRAAGEFTPIFFKKELKLITNDTFWLSTTPFEPSKYPGTYLCRICTVGRFAFTAQPDMSFTVLNSHMDHASDPARRLGASLLLWRARFEAIRTKSPVFVVGDLNSTSNGEDSGAYKILTGTAPPETIPSSFSAKYPIQPHELPDFKLVDLRSQTPQHKISGNFATYTGFGSPTDTSQWSRIDFIFGGSNGGWTGKRYSAVSGLSDDGLLASDHRPVFAELLAAWSQPI